MKEKKSKKALKIVAIVLGVLIAVYCAYYLTAMIAFGDNMPMPFGFGAAVVLTGSMEPTLSANDLIFVARSAEYKTDDIVVYSTAGTPVVHRIISIDRESGILTTQGDANNVADDPVSLSRVKGKVIGSIPFVGVIPKFVRTVPGMILTLVVLFVLLFLSRQSKNNAAEDKQSTEKIDEMLNEIRKLREEAEASQSKKDAPDNDGVKKEDKEDQKKI
ncbi:MAG: signal peptidase I [Clostridia bacterium]|nr:signal peptidase I [Clostridia bacterium]